MALNWVKPEEIPPGWNLKVLPDNTWNRFFYTNGSVAVFVEVAVNPGDYDVILTSTVDPSEDPDSVEAHKAADTVDDAFDTARTWMHDIYNSV